MSVGSLEAIRDWGNGFFYTKEEIADFFIKSSEGLLPYKLTIMGRSSVNVTLVEDIQTDPQTYTITTDSNGKYTGVFLFHEDSPLLITGSDSSYLEYTLSSQEDTIELVPLVIATPIMTSNTTPNTVGVCRANSEMTYSGKLYAAWRAFTQNPNVDPQWTPSGTAKDGWIEYEFNDPTIIKKIEVYVPAWGSSSGRVNNRHCKAFELLASNDKTNWTTLWSKDADYTWSVDNNGYIILKPKRPISDILDNNTAYKVYRLNVEQFNNGIGPAINCINLYKLGN